MQGEHRSQDSFFGMICEELIPSDHLLRKLSAAVDFGFVRELVSDCYCPDKGRPSWDPLVLFKVVFLQFPYDLSDREIEEQVNLHLACKSPTRHSVLATAHGLLDCNPKKPPLTIAHCADSALRRAQGRELVERQPPETREVSADISIRSLP